MVHDGIMSKNAGPGKDDAFAKPSKSDDPFHLPHLGDYLRLQQLHSTLFDNRGAPRADAGDMGGNFVHDEDRVLVKVVHYGHPTSAGIEYDENGEWQFKPTWARRAGPRSWIYFEPNKVIAAILTSGGLCPGLNDVIRQIVYTLEIYGVTDILGIQYGFRGFSDPKIPPIPLNRKIVQRINMQGGSFLGVTRGGPKISELVDKLQAWKVNMLFVIGGNGSHAGAYAIYKEVWARKLKLAIVGVPKTIDNDFLLVDKSFGFDTAVEEAQRVINAAYVEASSAYNGVGIVKLMGRHSGFIAMHATLASGQVDMVFIPEVPFVMDGENGVLAYMKKKLDKYGICVVVIAEGAGQELLEKTGSVDASGNTVLADIGKWFYNQVKAYFSKIKMPADVKYIDPTYMIRARPCNSADHIFCSVLGQNAVHAAFGGYTNVTVGLVNTHYCLLPIPVVIKRTRTVDPNSNMWHRCVTATGQPDFTVSKAACTLPKGAPDVNPPSHAANGKPAQSSVNPPPAAAQSVPPPAKPSSPVSACKTVAHSPMWSAARSPLSSPARSPASSPGSSPTTSPGVSPRFCGAKLPCVHRPIQGNLSVGTPGSSRPPSPPCCHLHRSATHQRAGPVQHTPACARPATAPASAGAPAPNTKLRSLIANPQSGDVVVTVFLHYSKGRKGECVGVVQTAAGVFEWPTVAVRRLVWEAGGDTLMQALTPVIASWYSDYTGAKAVQPMFLAYCGMLQGHRVAQFRLPACSHNSATWTGGLSLLHPDVLESQLYTPMVPAVRTLTGNPCRF